MPRIWQVFGSDAHTMTAELLEAMEAWRLVPEGGTVALKPNLVLPAVAEGGAVTHPGVLSGCIEHFLAHGVPARNISVIESSWVGARTMASMRRAGYEEVLSRYGVAFHDLKRDETRGVQTAIGPMQVCGRALDAGLLVDLPVLKGHCQTRMTCALKNLKGCIPDSEKRRFHTLGLTRPIAALATALRPGLTVVDAICGDLDFEEGGTPVRMERMYATADPILADAFGRTLMGLEPDEVPYIELAERFGAGGTHWELQDVVSLNEPTSTSAASPARQQHHAVARLVRGVHENGACSACYASLVRALYALGGPAGRDIYIGQGWQGAQLEGLGIGRCCAGATNCVMGCPPPADAIARALRQ